MQKSILVLTKILNLALENGISHWDLSFSDLDLDESYETHFWPCIDWLENEGLIRVGEHARTLGGLADGSAMNVSLTARGMMVLGQEVTLGGEEIRFGTSIQRASKDRAYFNQVGDFLGGLLGGFTKSIGSG